MKEINVVIPAAGAGKRFIEKGYNFPKPFIRIDYGGEEMPMLQAVIQNLFLDMEYWDLKLNIYVLLQSKHIVDCINDILYIVRYLSNTEIRAKILVIPIDKVTEGAACTVLLAKNFIDNDVPLIIANCDQLINYSTRHYLNEVAKADFDGLVMTFPSNNKKWSYARLVEGSEEGFIAEIKEKQPISEHATVGIYAWARGKDFVRNAEAMISANDRVNNEFYVAPSYNYLIREEGKVKTYPVYRMIGLGTPEDLESYNITKSMFK